MRIATIRGPLAIGADYSRLVPAAKFDQATPPLLNVQSPHNLGDWFVTKIVDRLLDYDELIIVDRDAHDHDWDYINKNCAALVLKGGNFIQPRWLSQRFGIALFKKIKIPIILFGAGLQAPLAGSVEFESEERDILRYIHDSCAYSAVRGNCTAECLAKIGIRNALVTGCPTIFWSRKPRLQIRAPDRGSAGFTYRQGLFSSDRELYKAQFRAIEGVRDQFGSVQVFLQGEEVLLQHYHQATRWGAEFEGRVMAIPDTKMQRLERRPLNADAIALSIHERLDKYADPLFVSWLMESTFFSYDISEYIREFSSIGLVIGCRLHGNLLALAHETPTFFLTYDQRTEELVDLLAIPAVKLKDFDNRDELLGQDWRSFEKKYAHYYQQMRKFMEANGLKHRLRSGATEAPANADQREPAQSSQLN
jgi:polysaccharide pyruvyl transferase WcaK-like protein